MAVGLAKTKSVQPGPYHSHAAWNLDANTAGRPEMGKSGDDPTNTCPFIPRRRDRVPEIDPQTLTTETQYGSSCELLEDRTLACKPVPSDDGDNELLATQVVSLSKEIQTLITTFSLRVS